MTIFPTKAGNNSVDTASIVETMQIVGYQEVFEQLCQKIDAVESYYRESLLEKFEMGIALVRFIESNKSHGDSLISKLAAELSIKTQRRVSTERLYELIRVARMFDCDRELFDRHLKTIMDMETAWSTIVKQSLTIVSEDENLKKLMTEGEKNAIIHNVVNMSEQTVKKAGELEEITEKVMSAMPEKKSKLEKALMEVSDSTSHATEFNLSIASLGKSLKLMASGLKSLSIAIEKYGERIRDRDKEELLRVLITLEEQIEEVRRKIEKEQQE